jgi:hypothetical protein
MSFIILLKNPLTPHKIIYTHSNLSYVSIMPCFIFAGHVDSVGRRWSECEREREWRKNLCQPDVGKNKQLYGILYWAMRERDCEWVQKQLNWACKKMSHHSFLRHSLLTASDSLMDRQIYTFYERTWKKKHIIECMSRASFFTVFSVGGDWWF